MNFSKRAFHRAVLALKSPLALWALLLLLPCSALFAQQPEKTGNVQLNFPEQFELQLLVDYVSKRLDIKILYDEEVSNKKITIKAPNEIPASSLLGLLESALKMKQMALVDADEPGWKQIVSSRDLTRIAQPSDREKLPEAGGTAAVTQAFPLTHIDPQNLSQIVKPFLTEPGANTIIVADQNLLIITDYASNLKRIAQLISTIDREGPPSMIEFYTAKHVEAQALAQQISKLLATRQKSFAQQPAQVSQDERTNQLVIVGSREAINKVLQLVRTLDVPLGLTTEIYTFQYVAAERIDKLLQELIDPLTLKRLYRSAIDVDDNLLIVTAPDSLHQQIEWLKQQMDLQGKQPASAVKFYKLKNARAEEVMQTLQSIQQTSGGGAYDSFPGPRGVSPLGRGPTGTAGYSLGQPLRDQFVPGPNYPATPLQNEPTLPPASRTEQAPQAGALPSENGSILVSATARVTADPFTNSIIVIGDRASHEVYKTSSNFWIVVGLR